MPTDSSIRPQPAGPPSACPYCQSPDIAATGRVTEQSYYRCNRCRQVWHPDRVAGGGRLDFRRSR